MFAWLMRHPETNGGHIYHSHVVFRPCLSPCIKFVINKRQKGVKYVFDVVLVFYLLTLKIFHFFSSVSIDLEQVNNSWENQFLVNALIYFNAFHFVATFKFPLKSFENQKFSDDFRGNRELKNTKKYLNRDER